MNNIFSLRNEITAAARATYVPKDAKQEYEQVLSVILQLRTAYKPLRNGERTIGRNVAWEFLAKAKGLKAAMTK